MGFLDMQVGALEDPAAVYAAQPQVSGTHGGHTVSLQSLARDGAILLGRVLGIEGYTLKLGADLMECIAFADEKSAAFKAAIDTFIDREGIQAEAPAPDPGEPPLPDLRGSSRWDELDLHRAGAACVIWCIGFDADWSWVRAGVFDEQGRPRHQAGVTDSHGLYFIGFPWLSKRKSGILYGVSEDAGRIVEHIQEHVLASRTE
jgi:putative flavoprotein involved in K+ transport